ncbi:MAG: hypothetical protein ACHBN1_31260 [Heteroscytonema crispum UTEX LB 1556]
MTNLTKIVFLQDTVIKQQPVQSSQLPSNQRQNIPAGTVLILQSYAVSSRGPDHYRLTLQDVQFKGYTGNWYAFASHVDIIQEPVNFVPTVDAILSKQQDKNTVRIIVDRQSVGDQQGFLKLVFNIDSIIKRKPVDSKVLNDQSKQTIPAGTELILLTSKPDTNNVVRFAIEQGHVKFTLKDVELKGFSQDWYAFNKHVGIERVG